MNENYVISTELQERLKKAIATYPNFPKSGVNFKDIQSILSDPTLGQSVLEETTNMIYFGTTPPPDAILGFDARGFLFGYPLALALDIPFIMARKANKLPGELVTVSFEKEYGTDTLSIQKGLIIPGMKVLVHDDLLATGGTTLAAVELIQKEGGSVYGFHFIMELGYLDGRKKIEDYGQVISMVNYETPDQ